MLIRVQLAIDQNFVISHIIIGELIPCKGFVFDKGFDGVESRAFIVAVRIRFCDECNDKEIGKENPEFCFVHFLEEKKETFIFFLFFSFFMEYVTTETIQGKKIMKTLGTVTGSSVRGRWVGADIIAGLRNLVGGEIVEYSELLEASRQQAVGRMLDEAKKNGANAVVGVRFATSPIAQQALEILAYGTAVVVK